MPKQPRKKKVMQRTYRCTLDKSDRAQYDAKLKSIDGNDPYELTSWSLDVNLLPDLVYFDIVNYLAFSPGPYTLGNLKTYKDIEAYYQFLTGCVSEISTVLLNDSCTVKAQVRDSQQSGEKLFTPWIISELGGTILSSHCDCKTGLSETCTHIGALLFAVDDMVKIRKARTVTQDPAYWLVPRPDKQVKDIDFTSPMTRKRKLDNGCADDQSSENSDNDSPLKNIPEPTPEELAVLYDRLHASGTKPAILSLIPKYAHFYIPTAIREKEVKNPSK